MASIYIWSLLLMTLILVNDCTSAIAHGHGLDSGERAEDGSFRGKDADHYGDSGHHNPDFDHEAILGRYAAPAFLFILLLTAAYFSVMTSPLELP